MNILRFFLLVFSIYYNATSAQTKGQRTKRINKMGYENDYTV